MKPTREEAMTKTLKLLALLLPLLISQGVLGQSTRYDASLYDRIPVSLAAKVKNPKALETFYGDVIEIRKIREPKAVEVEQILKGSQIELKTGEIFYPEEVEFLLSLKPGIKDRAPHEKAPHTPN